jgi:hypothetical protein
MTIITCASVIAPSVKAESPVPTAATYDRILLPIATGQIAGAFGSLWMADIVVHNGDAATRDLDADEYCVSECASRVLQPRETRHILFRGEPAGNPGQIIFVENPDERVAFESRIQDISRQAQTWGTEIPVVRESSFLSRPIDLLNVPVDRRFRLMVRIYDIDGRSDASVRVSAYSFPARGDALGEIDLPLTPPIGTHPRYKPSYVQFSDVLQLVPPGVNPGSVLVLRITPITPSLRIWAFVSVTNNETQHVTTITPQ